MKLTFEITLRRPGRIGDEGIYQVIRIGQAGIRRELELVKIWGLDKLISIEQIEIEGRD